jgi:hypothetical protein
MSRSSKQIVSREFNPAEFRGQMTELASGDPRGAADVATVWRERFHNISTETQHITGFLIDLGLTSVSAGVMAYMDGLWDAERAEIQKQFDAQSSDINGGIDVETGHAKYTFEDAGVDDPAKLFGIVDTNLLITLGAAGAAMFKLLDFSKGDSKKNDYTFLARDIAVGGACRIMGEISHNAAFDSRQKELAKVENHVEYKFTAPVKP